MREFWRGARVSAVSVDQWQVGSRRVFFFLQQWGLLRLGAHLPFDTVLLIFLFFFREYILHLVKTIDSTTFNRELFLAFERLPRRKHKIDGNFLVQVVLKT